MHTTTHPKQTQTWLRVHLGLHTAAQVLVGAALGAASAIAWARLGAAWALPTAAAHPRVEAGLVGATVVAGVAFAAGNLVPGMVAAAAAAATRRPCRNGVRRR
jgi:hypothetical protein